MTPAQQQGYDDYKDGRKLTQNRFPKGKDHQGWITGWYKARGEDK